MSDKLKDYIQENRSAFDQLEPPDIWNAVATGMKQPGFTLKPKNYKTMIKYGFGASAIVVASFVALQSGEQKPATNHQTVATAKTEKHERTVFDTTPAIINAFEPVIGKPSKKSPVEKTATFSAPTELTKDVLEEVSTPPEYTNENDASENTPTEISVGDSTNVPEHISIDTLFKGIKRLEVNGQVCNIKVTSHKSDHTRLHGEIKEGGGDLLMLGMKAYKRKEYKIKFLRNNDVLKVWIEDHKLHPPVKCSPDSKIESFLEFEVPEKTTLNLYNCSGNITLTGLISERTELKTNFGNITVEQVEGELHTTSNSGNITVGKVRGPVRSVTSFGDQKFGNMIGDVVLKSSSGDITLKNLQGNAEIISTFGDQLLEDISGNIKSRSSSGDITIRRHTGNSSVKSTFGTQVYDTVEGEINSSASSGDIKINDHKGQLSLGTSFGSIKGKNITLLKSSDFKASSGNISMTFLNNLEDLSFDLVSSSGDLRIERSELRKKSDNELQHGNGPIRIKGVTSFGNQSYH